jgi:hypothetical protein
VKKANAPKLLKKHFKQLAQIEKANKKRAAKRKAVRQEMTVLRKHPKVAEFLLKQKKTRRMGVWKDHIRVRDKKYSIGATDYGTGLLAIEKKTQTIDTQEFNVFANNPFAN